MIRFCDTPQRFSEQKLLCQFGITEAIGFGIGDLIGGDAVASFLGFGADEAATGAAAAAGPTAFGTATDYLAAPTFDALSGGAASGTGADVLGTVGSYFAAPGALGVGTGAADLLGTGAAASGADAAASSSAATGLSSATPGALAPGAPVTTLESLISGTPTAGPGTMGVGSGPTSYGGPFQSATGSPSAITPGTGTGASAISAPTGVSSIADPTAAATGAAPAATGSTAATPAAPSTMDSLLSKLSPGNLASSAVDSVTKNPLATAIGVGGLGYNILQGQKNTANIQSLTNTANKASSDSASLVSEGQALQQYLTNGTLPPQYMETINNAVQSAKAKAISDAAAQGQSTDPTKNTSLATTLSNIDNQVPGMITQVGTQLAQSGQGLIGSGAQLSGLSGQLYTALVQNDTTQAANIGKSIATLASALNGKSSANVGGVTISA